MQPVRNACGLLAIALNKVRLGFGMGQVESAFPGDQELAPHRAHAVEQIDLVTGGADSFGSEQSRWAAANDGNPTWKDGHRSVADGVQHRFGGRHAELTWGFHMQNVQHAVFGKQGEAFAAHAHTKGGGIHFQSKRL